MKNKFFYSMLLTAASLFGVVSSANADTNVTVIGKDGVKKTIALTESGVIYFQDNQMVVLPSTASDAQSLFSIPSIQKVLFGDGAGVVNVLAEGQAVLYPTLATTDVTLANASADVKNVQIYNYAGQLVIDEAFQNGKSINVANLPAGSYILKAGSSTFKFQKK